MKWFLGVLAILGVVMAIAWSTRGDVFWIIWSAVFAILNGWNSLRLFLVASNNKFDPTRE
jgi:hypothetical protein